MIITIKNINNEEIKYDIIDCNNIDDNDNIKEIKMCLNSLEKYPNISSPNVEKINIAINIITTLPHDFFLNFIHLTHFNISYNKLSFIPDINLPNLVHLDCSNNMLTFLPNMELPKLHELNCSNNNITEFPIKFALPKLKILKCICNKFTHLPNEKDIPDIEEIHFAFNKLIRRPDYATKIKYFDYYKN